MMKTLIGLACLAIMTSSGLADVIVDMPAPPKASSVATGVDAGDVALARFGSPRSPHYSYANVRQPRYGSSPGYGHGYGYGYGYGYGCSPYWPHGSASSYVRWKLRIRKNPPCEPAPSPCPPPASSPVE